MPDWAILDIGYRGLQGIDPGLGGAKCVVSWGTWGTRRLLYDQTQNSSQKYKKGVLKFLLEEYLSILATKRLLADSSVLNVP
jgi:hypothetical protein